VGSGCGLELGKWLKNGDIVELEIEGIGVLRNKVERKQ
jgi:2-keto-4-pentenoate hydratase/2-oxohepta-3-ene-1,7-dioic acid hydratase in catechol pathway